MISYLHFPERHASTHGSPRLYQMTRTDFEGADMVFRIGKTKLTHEGHSKVYLARMTLDGCDSEYRDVVCKVARGPQAIDRLRNEAKIYWKLRRLQCDTIPGCYGLFEGELEDGLSACLVTEYCGEPAEAEMIKTNPTFRRSVIKALIQIHDHGVRHCDFRDCNIVVDGTQNPVIIDFDRAELHECHCPPRIIMGATMPFEDLFGCDELFEVCENLQIWKPHLVRYLDGLVHARYLESPEKLASLAPDTVALEEALERAQLVIQKYERKWGKWVRPEYDYLEGL